MPDSLQNITIDPAIAHELDRFDASVLAEEQISRATETAPRAKVSAPKVVEAKADTVVHEAPLRKAIVMTAHKDPQMPVSPRSMGSVTTSWVILGLIAVFLLVSMRYARNFKFLSGIGRELISIRPRRRMFDDTVRETSFLIFLNLLCVVSVGVLLFGAIEVLHPELRSSAQWYTALAVTTGCVGAYYIWQWAAYFIIGRTFGTIADAASWMRGFSSGQGFLGLALFPLALLSIFYARNLYLVVIFAGAAYLVMRILFIIKGVRIFLPRSSSWMPFFYYLCGVEIAPVVLLFHLSTQFCMDVAAP